MVGDGPRAGWRETVGARISEVDAELGAFLETSVRTGTYCCFRP